MRTAHRSVALVFVVYGCFVATWVSRIPLVKERLGLDAGELGLALLGGPVGSVLVTRVASGVLHRHSSRATTSWGLLVACAALVLPALAVDIPTLAACLFVNGAALGMLDIAMNTQAVHVERARGRSVMSGIHGTYSIGFLVGAVAGAGAAHAGISPVVHFAVVAAGVAPVAWIVFPRMLPDGDGREQADDAPVSAGRHAPRGRWTRPLVTLGAVAFCSMLAESSIDSWSGVYLHEVRHASLGVAPLAAAACGVGMAIGRFRGDSTIDLIGPERTLVRGSALCAAALLAALVAPTAWLVVVAYFVAGLGVATIVPIAFSLAGAAGGAAPTAWSISRVTTMGYAGLFAGPPVIGVLARMTGLTIALVVPAALLLAVAAGAAVRRGRRRSAQL